MSQARYIIGDALTELRKMPDNSVDLVFSSPPFLALRSYLPADHESKHLEIGSEATPGEFIDTLLDVVVECRRVLAPHGSLVFELGDTFAGSRGADPDALGLREGQPREVLTRKQRVTPDLRRNGAAASYADGGDVRLTGGAGWPLDKSLCLIPQSFAWALSYGRNPFTGREIEPWRVRNVVAWCRPNPPVGALGDKFRPATSYLTVACMSRDRYFDLDAVRQPYTSDHKDGEGIGNNKGGENGYSGFGRDVKTRVLHPAGAPPLDYWVIPTQPYKGSHYATFPTALVVRPVEAMCPRKVCRVCGQPSRRITHNPDPWQEGFRTTPENGEHRNPMTDASLRVSRIETLGWSDCGHDDYRPGLCLDPFAGSGTTLEVATGHGRDAIGIDLDPRNAELAYERIGGLFLSIEESAA